MTKSNQASTAPCTPCGHIDVISCGINFPHHADIFALIEKADIVFGSRSLLASCPLSLQNTRIIAAHAYEDAKTALALCHEGKHVVVLASGDALYHGFGGTIAKLRAGNESICYHPAITAFQALFHRLGMPWNEIRLFSAHAGKSHAVRCIATAPFSVTYGGTAYPANAIAKALIDFHPALSERHALMAENLAQNNEKIVQGSLAELASIPCGPTSILLIVPESYQIYLRTVPHVSQENTLYPHTIAEQQSSLPSQSSLPDQIADQTSLANQAPLLSLGLPEENYEQENNLITASDVRAIILARLRLPTWGIVWDIGAGSGSVGLEAAGLCPNLHVIGIEQHQSRVDIIEHNRVRMGLINYTVQTGDALNLLNNIDKEKKMPRPDRIFIGGGGHKLTELLTLCMDHLAPEGLLVVSAVTLESFHILSSWSPERRTALSSIHIAHEQSIAGAHHHLKAQNTIYLFTFRKEITS